MIVHERATLEAAHRGQSSQLGGGTLAPPNGADESGLNPRTSTETRSKRMRSASSTAPVLGATVR